MRYGRVVVWLPVLLGFGYAAAAFQADAYQVVRKHVYPNETMIGAITNLGCMGAAAGMFLSLGLAPRAFLVSEKGQSWVQTMGLGGGVVLFRIKMLGLAAFILLGTAVLLDVAFLQR
jgi:hypothetical protein